MKRNMENFINAMQIFLKKENKEYPFYCTHDLMTVCYNPKDFSKEEIKELEDLGFNVDEYQECFTSYCYGSC